MQCTAMISVRGCQLPSPRLAQCRTRRLYANETGRMRRIGTFIVPFPDSPTTFICVCDRCSLAASWGPYAAMTLVSIVIWRVIRRTREHLR